MNIQWCENFLLWLHNNGEFRKLTFSSRLQDEIDSGRVDNPDIIDTKNEDKYEDGEVSMGGAQPTDPKLCGIFISLQIFE